MSCNDSNDRLIKKIAAEKPYIITSFSGLRRQQQHIVILTILRKKGHGGGMVRMENFEILQSIPREWPLHPQGKCSLSHQGKSPSKFPIPPQPRTLWRRQHVAALEGGNQQRTYAICVTLQKSRLWSLIKVHLVKKISGDSKDKHNFD